MKDEVLLVKLGNTQAVVEKTAGVFAEILAFSLFPAESLSAVESLVQVEIRLKNVNVVTLDNVFHSMLLKNIFAKPVIALDFSIKLY